MPRKKIDKRGTLTVVTDNELINAKDLPKLSLNARKLFYIALAQCSKEDKEFYEYETTPAELAEMWGIDRSNVYRAADSICDELMKFVITLRSGKKGFKKRHLFEKIDYDDNSTVVFKLHKEMANLVLGVNGHFSKPLMWDFMRMRSPYSMAIWHLLQKKMKSFKPMMSEPKIFDISVEELREVTGTEGTYKQIGQFKKYILDKALREIQKNCLVDVHYTDRKTGRIITHFQFTAESMLGTVDPSSLTYRQRLKMRKIALIHKKVDGIITVDELRELEDIREELETYELEDFDDAYIIKDEREESGL